MRKIFPAAQTQTTTVARVSNTESRTCQRGGPGWSAIRRNISMGVAGGKREMAVEKVLSGFWRTRIQVSMGNMISSMAGIIRMIIEEHLDPIPMRAFDF